ncbi:MAG: phosphoribosyltransferase family protein [Acidimicrobiales bacterium]|nr:phosphoribosyltransferase family protein [Acidimicrobiales bacterium]
MNGPKLHRTAEEIEQRIDAMAEELVDWVDVDTVVVGVLKGCLPFMADLVRRFTVPVEIDFLALSTFLPDSGRVRLTRDLSIDVTGRDVLLVEGVVDTGFRLDYLRRHLASHGAAEVRVCTLFDRADRRVLPIDLEHVGFDTGATFLVGFGLDHRGEFRNLPAVVEVDLTELDRGGSEMVDAVRNTGRADTRN